MPPFCCKVASLPLCDSTVASEDDQFHANKGSFTHGVVIKAGGAPGTAAKQKVYPRATVLFTSESERCKPNASIIERIKQGTIDEKQRLRGGFIHGTLPMKCRSLKKPAEIHPGLVLAVFPNLHSKVASKRDAEEKPPTFGGFCPGKKIWAGGEPSELPLPKVKQPATVLYSTDNPAFIPSTRFLPEMKPGCENERCGRHGSFDTAPRLCVSSCPDWLKTQSANRRYGPGHYVAGGATVMLGGRVPSYVTSF